MSMSMSMNANTDANLRLIFEFEFEFELEILASSIPHQKLTLINNCGVLPNCNFSTSKISGSLPDTASLKT